MGERALFCSSLSASAPVPRITGILRLSPRRTRQPAPRIPRVETRWRNAATAGEQCLGSKDHKERPKVKIDADRESGGHALVSEMLKNYVSGRFRKCVHACCQVRQQSATHQRLVSNSLLAYPESSINCSVELHGPFIMGLTLPLA